MEEDIKILEEVCKRPIKDTEGTIRMKQAIENLINKYKEQERDIRDNHTLLAKYSQKNEEQEKIIDLMHEDMKLEGYLKMSKEELYEYYRKRIKKESEAKE